LGGAQKELAMAGQDGDPRHHTQKMAKTLQDTITHLREDVKKVDEPQLKAMFETAAEVLGGLVKAFKDYEQKNEAAWRK
jgi:rubrerythrin